MESVPIYIVDAFSPKPFGGNPAAVCLLNIDIPDETKQKIAMEMNLSETAFVVPIPHDDVTKGDNLFSWCKRFSLRWFTPTTEVPLCGHATLATSAVLFYIQNNQQNVEFVTRSSGILEAKRCEDSSKGLQLIEMRLPLNPPVIEITERGNPDIWKLVKAILVGKTPAEVWLSSTTKKLLIRLEDSSRDFLENLKVEKESLLAIDTNDAVRGVIITTQNHDEYDFVSRYFAPWVGIPEDPVTGSAHTVLAPFWSKKLEKRKLFARQCSSRGGELRLEVTEDSTIVRGEATIVLQGVVKI